MSEIFICTDGASLPHPLRVLIETFYPAWVIKAIDDAGYLHDYWSIIMDRDKEARKEFDRDLKDNGLKFSKKNPIRTATLPILRKVILFGLFLYDESPSKLKKIMKKSVTKDLVCKMIDLKD